MCATGKFSNAVGGSSAQLCTPCADGLVAAEGSARCSNCTGDYEANGGQGACERKKPAFCQAGEMALSSTRCGNCSAGRFAADAGSRHQCLECGVGYFSAINGSSSCAACAPNKVTGFFATATACTDCGEGEVRDKNFLSCFACNAGKHKVQVPLNRTYTYECRPCASGTVASASSVNCTRCVGGEFADTNGAACTSCPSNTYHFEPSEKDCTTCPALGTECLDSQIQILENFWVASPVNTSAFEIGAETTAVPVRKRRGLSPLTAQCAARRLRHFIRIFRPPVWSM